jgi:hypothetical protein
MAINQNHLFEELNGVKCAIVEKNVGSARVEFLRGILEYNGYSVAVVPTPPPKAAAVPGAGGAGIGAAGPAGASGAADGVAAAPAPETSTVGVTDVTFNPINAVFGRLLKAPGGHIVTLAYWQQKDIVPDDEKPYFEGR